MLLNHARLAYGKSGRICVMLLSVLSSALLLEALLFPAIARAAVREPLVDGGAVEHVGIDVSIWRESAEDALEAGLPSVALATFERLAVQSPALLEDAGFVRVMSAALIDSGQAGEASRFLAAHPVDAPWWRLHKTLADIVDGQSASFDDRLDVDSLEPSQRPWYFLARGLVESRSGDSKKAADLYSKAMDGASDSIKAQIELLLMRDQLRQGTATNSDVAELRQRFRDMQGQKGGFDAARLLAVALTQLGREQEALGILDEQLRYIGVDEGGMREELLMLVGIVAGPQSSRGRVALQQVLMNSEAPRNLLENALAMLASGGESENGSSLREIIDTVISRDASHPLMDELLLMRSDLSVREGRLEEAAADAQRIIDQFPASALRHAALRTLAYLSYVRTPPQYRTSASYLSQLRSELPDGTERAKTGLLIADCFFLNGDYANAASVYSDIQDEQLDELGMVFYQMVLSLLRAGRLDEAREALDGMADSDNGSVDPIHRWRAEWNLIYTMRAKGQSEEAFARLAAMLSQERSASLPQSLRLRLMWLEAQLSLDAGQPEQTPERCQTIMDAIAGMTDAELDKSQREMIYSHALLLKAQALLVLGKEAEAVESLEQLRGQYPASRAAQNSYLVQARWLVGNDRLVEGQRLLLALADKYKGGEQAPVALWEAALAAEQRGLEATYREAISLLERLVGEYPESDLVFFARLRQGDILRKLNDFPTALLAYEDLLNRFPRHPSLHLAHMSRADCIIAQSSNNPARRADGTAIYERLMERQDLPADFRAEASFKWAYNLAKAGDSSRAIDAYWLGIDRYTKAGDSVMGARGRYWVARSAVELGQLLESAGRYEEARRVYAIMLSGNMPGRALALARLKRLDEPAATQ
ncbi:MAG: tetratricopeptide repeat protein [Opitutales bacterium]|nr:tetratricopeptide repeat protein [Opitutales bacterium]